MSRAEELAAKRCVPCHGGVEPLGLAEVEALALEGWAVNDELTTLTRTFEFRNFHRTMAFVNAVAWIAHQEDHHPDLEVGYKHCRVSYTTHAIGGLSENDFICAAKIDALVS